jgi:hypothetical protein
MHDGEPTHLCRVFPDVDDLRPEQKILLRSAGFVVPHCGCLGLPVCSPCNMLLLHVPCDPRLHPQVFASPTGVIADSAVIAACKVSTVNLAGYSPDCPLAACVTGQRVAAR